MEKEVKLCSVIETFCYCRSEKMPCSPKCIIGSLEKRIVSLVLPFRFRYKTYSLIISDFLLVPRNITSAPRELFLRKFYVAATKFSPGACIIWIDDNMFLENDNRNFEKSYYIQYSRILIYLKVTNGIFQIFDRSFRVDLSSTFRLGT